MRTRGGRTRVRRTPPDPTSSLAGNAATEQVGRQKSEPKKETKKANQKSEPTERTNRANRTTNRNSVREGANRNGDSGGRAVRHPMRPAPRDSFRRFGSPFFRSPFRFAAFRSPFRFAVSLTPFGFAVRFAVPVRRSGSSSGSPSDFDVFAFCQLPHQIHPLGRQKTLIKFTSASLPACA
jgi:hypothetical protein